MGKESVAPLWALVGKDPGDKGDYRILRGSGDHAGGHGGDGLARQIWAAVPGTPQLGSLPGPGQLPWATFVPSRDAAGRQWMAVTAVDTTDKRDQVGRPNFEIRFVRLPFADLAAGRTGYQALHAAIPPAAELPEEGEVPGPAGPLTFTLPETDPAVAEALADPAIFARTARLAAAVLGGDVVIELARQSPYPLTARLAEFDRIAALLPFGMRAGTAVATWHDGAQATPFRLAYGPFAARGQTLATFGDVAAPASEAARQYLSLLAELHGKHGAAQVVEYLSMHRDPLGPGDALEACQILHSRADPSIVVAATRVGPVPVERVVNVRRYAADRLDQNLLDELETDLMKREGDDARAEIERKWSPRSAALAARLALSSLAAPDSLLIARRLHELAAGLGDAEGFLSALAERRSLDDAPVPAKDVAWLLNELHVPARGEMPSVRPVVLRDPPLARWLLRLSLRDTAGTWRATWLDWLEPGDGTCPGWLRPYAGLTTGFDLPRPWAAGIPPATKVEDVALAARYAYRNGPLEEVTDAWWPVLAEAVRTRPGVTVPDPACGDLIVLAEEAESLSPGLPTATRLDTLRLYLGLPPRYFPLSTSASACRRYLDALWALWSDLPAGDDVSVLAGHLIRAIFPAPDGTQAKGSGGGPVSESAITLLIAIVHDDRIPLSGPIAGLIADACAASPALLDDPRLDQDWWRRIEIFRPELREPAARFRAALRQRDADPVEIAVLLGKAVGGGARADLIAIARPWLAIRTPAEISAILRIIDGVRQLSAGGDRGPAADDDYFRSMVRELQD